jgi:hypothetical protein
VPRARAVAPPPESALAPLYAGAHLVDAYAASLAPGDPRDARALAQAALDRPPPWFRALLAIRDTAVGALGLKTSADLREAARRDGGDHIDFFRVLDRRGDELVLGEDDRHLDFRLSVLRRAGRDGGSEVVLTTVVHCHNHLGRAYLAVIRPMHGLVVRRMAAAIG